MTRLTWDARGERFYETGVDRGVLYVGSNPGVPWPGLISVAESPTGGEAKAYYQEGRKYLNLSSKEEFEATINAFAAPKEFAPCDGVASVQNGLFVTQQPRKSFNFSYRTKIGNDVDGKSHAYKIHLVYNALAGPSERNNQTIGDSTEPSALSWQITTLPPSMSGLKPTAHFVVDTRYTPAGILRYLEDMIYGSDASMPRMPTAAELLDLFRSPGPIVARNLSTNPSVETNLATIGNGFSGATLSRDNTRAKTGAYSVKAVATGTGSSVILWTVPTIIGQTYTFGVWGYAPAGTVPMQATAYFISNTSPNATKDQWVRLQHTFIATASSTQVGLSTYGPIVVGTNMWGDSLVIVEGEELPETFDGSTPALPDTVYEWVGDPHASQSVKRSLL